MSDRSESCSICGASFPVQFRYQTEEREGATSFYCTQSCLQKSSERAGVDGFVGCDACSRRFRVELVTNIVYLRGQRRYACSLECRSALAHEAMGAPLGQLAPAAPVVAAPVVAAPSFAAAPVVAASIATPLAAALFSPKPAPRAAEFRAGVTRLDPAAPSPSPPVSAVPSEVAGSSSEPQPRVLAVFNHKGGTGKTTTSVNIAAGLAARGKRVLIVDTDAQGNVAVSLNVKATRSLYHVVVMGLPIEEAVMNVRPNLDLLGSNETLAAAELYLAGRQNRDRVLSQRLAKATSLYDVVVLDCSPSLSLMNQNALVFADSLLVPVACDYLSLVGVRQVIRTVKNVNQLLHHPVRIWGVLPTFYDSRARICREAVETLQQHFGSRCLPPIRAAMKVKEAPAQGQTLFEYAGGSNAAEDYLRVVDRLLGVVDRDAVEARELSA